jgi:hypothetical protein
MKNLTKNIQRIISSILLITLIILGIKYFPQLNETMEFAHNSSPFALDSINLGLRLFPAYLYGFGLILSINFLRTTIYGNILSKPFYEIKRKLIVSGFLLLLLGFTFLVTSFAFWTWTRPSLFIILFFAVVLLMLFIVDLFFLLTNKN